ncbi:SDR family oxidoreductase [Bradyrhizobium sp. UFLA05-109]
MGTERKVAIITGASQGIGEALVRAYRERTSLDEHAVSSVPSALAALTKGGLNAATKSLAIEYASKGIRVNAVAPGAVKTPMHAPETYDFLAKLHPVGRMGEVRDVVDAVLYLEGAAFTTGEILHVDGGQSAGH